MSFIAWWHRKFLKHDQEWSKVTIGVMDSSRGFYVKCSCKKNWAL